MTIKKREINKDLKLTNIFRHKADKPFYTAILKRTNEKPLHILYCKGNTGDGFGNVTITSDVLIKEWYCLTQMQIDFLHFILSTVFDEIEREVNYA